MNVSSALFFLATLGLASAAGGQDAGFLGVQLGDTLKAGQIAQAVRRNRRSLLGGGFRPTGRVIAWGRNEDPGRIVVGQSTVPADVAALTNVVAIAAGVAHSLALLSTGEVRAWGSNYFGQIDVPPSLSDVISVAAGGNISVALRSDGTVAAWGYNSTDGETAVPPGLANVTQVAVGCYHTLALHANGTVTAWGWNAYNQTAVPPGLSGVVEVACGCAHSLARLRNGSAVAWGLATGNRTTIPPGLSKVQGVSGGQYHSLIINNGAAIGFGYNGDNQVSPIPASAQSSVVKVAAGGYHSLALLKSGELVGWGADVDGQRTVPREALGIVLDIATGFRHSMAIVRVTGKVIAWGSNEDRMLNYAGQSAVPNDLAALSNVVEVAAGEAHSLALLSTGELRAWGNNLYGQATVPSSAKSDVVGVAAGGNVSVALRRDGTVVAWGFSDTGLQTAPPPGLSNVVQVAQGCFHTVALHANGTVTAWGYNADGEATPPPGLSGVVEVACGCVHSLARLRNGSAVAWGYSTSNRTNIPPGLSKVQGVAGGSFHSLIINNGAVTAFGYNGDNQTVVPSQALSNVAKVSAGGFHSLALLESGEVVGWGSNLQGQISVPNEAPGNVLDISAGFRHTLAIVRVTANPPPKPPPQLPPPAQPVPPTPSPTPGPTTPPAPAPVAPNPAPGPLSPSPVAPGPSDSPPSPGPSDVDTNTTPPATARESSTSSNTTVIVGAVVGAVGGVLLLAALIAGVVWWRKKRTGPPPASTGDAGLKPDGYGTPLTMVQMSAAAAAQPVGKGSPPSTGTWPPPGSGDAYAAIAVGAVAGSSYQPQPPPPPGMAGYPSAYGATPASSAGPSGPWTPPAPLSLASAGSREVYAPSTAMSSQDPLGLTRMIWDRKLSNMKIAWEDIAIDENVVLGKGGFGTVYKGMWQGSISVAVKCLQPEKLTPRAMDELRREAVIMCDMHHPAIAPVYGLVDDGVHHALVIRLYKRGSVAMAISRPAYSMLGLVERLQMAQQVASGMRSLHERKPAPVIHGDLKASNLLVEDDGKGVAIADFGLACCLREGQLGQVVESGALSVAISPPEVLESPIAPRTTAGDVYAFGILLMEITTGRPAFRGMKTPDVLRVVRSGGRPTIPAEVPADVASIITACWAKDAAARPTFAEVVVRMSHAIARAQQEELNDYNTKTTTLADVTPWA